MSWIDNCYSMVPEGIFTGATIAVLTCGLWLGLGVLDPVNPIVAVTLLLVALAAGAAAGAGLAVIAALVLRKNQTAADPSLEPQDHARPASGEMHDPARSHVLR